ncbi:ubiquinol-cytochrome-c reductase complex assembly factor 4 [Phymastichus coffea]|uniref:ubiquinol-cytochrome-c reductase complex assembly factor 4 n=1 Tax=Phymastichus coffea TaxID=108790 RepID=UPI00273B4ABD|nr:ubiquinol-cytochrome-c reductase complex assembly factor 4 [Phymastichus coffea]
MLMNRLCSTVANLRKINGSTSVLLQRTINTKSIDDDSDDKPIAFSTTEAAVWKAQHSRVPPNERVWYTPYVVSGSIATFMLYFCILREENDIDEIIYRPLPETLQGIEKVFPEMDFNTKPDYVLYHEKRKQNINTTK